MNRDVAKQIIRKAHFNLDDPNREGEIAVDKIYDDFNSLIKNKIDYILENNTGGQIYLDGYLDALGEMREMLDDK